MNRQEFNEEFSVLTDFYGKNPTASQTNKWFELLQKNSQQVLRKAINEYISTSKTAFFPSIGALNEICFRLWKNNLNIQEAEHERIKSLDMLNGGGGSRSYSRYLKCLQITMSMQAIPSFNYISFWKSINNTWMNCKTENEYNECMDVASSMIKTFKEENK